MNIKNCLDWNKRFKSFLIAYNDCEKGLLNDYENIKDDLINEFNDLMKE